VISFREFATEVNNAEHKAATVNSPGNDVVIAVAPEVQIVQADSADLPTNPLPMLKEPDTAPIFQEQ
jgi:hypothetical protein